MWWCQCCIESSKYLPSRGAAHCAGKDRYYLALTFYNQGNYESNVAFFFVNMVTFWLLFSYLVPISLFVTIEIVKFIQVRVGLVLLVDKMMLRIVVLSRIFKASMSSAASSLYARQAAMSS